MIGVLGWRAVLLYGDPCAFDRWLWLRRLARPGEVATLDAGTGNGAFAMYAASQGNEVVAVSDFPRRWPRASGVPGTSTASASA